MSIEIIPEKRVAQTPRIGYNCGRNTKERYHAGRDF